MAIQRKQFHYAKLTVLESFLRDNCPNISEIMDTNWFDIVKNEIAVKCTSESFQSQKAYLYFLLDGDTELALSLERRLAALKSLDAEYTANAITLLSNNRFSNSVNNYLFEVMVLGSFAEAGLLIETESPVGNDDSNIDGLICLDQHSVYVEITNTQQYLYDLSDGHVLWLDVKKLIKKFRAKVNSKYADGKQLHLVNENAILLVIGLNQYSADIDTATWAINEIFTDTRYNNLSGIIISNNCMYQSAYIYLNPQANYKLTESQQYILEDELGIAARHSRQF